MSRKMLPILLLMLALPAVGFSQNPSEKAQEPAKEETLPMIS